MKRFTALICVAVLTCALLVLPALSGAAPSSSEAAKKLKGMQSQMATAQKNYQNAADKLTRARKAAADSRAQLAQLNERIAVNRKALNIRANYLYRTGNASFLEVVFSSQSFSEVYSKVTLLGQVTDSNAQLLNSLRADMRQRMTAQADLDQALKTAQAQTAALKQQSDQATKDLAAQEAYVNALSAKETAALQAAQAAANNKRPSKPESGKNPGAGGGGDYTGTGTTFDGLATWYGVGKGTASGEPFDPNAMTAAHKTLPFGTLVRVTYKGKSVVVRINDRGPYGAGRVIDLTSAAAAVIGLKSAGVGYVTCEIVQ